MFAIPHFTRTSLLLFLLFFSGVHVFAQPYAVGHRQASFTDASRNNRAVTCEVYYPAQTAGDNVPAAAGSFPLLVFGHGFVMDWSAYDIYWNNLGPAGYVMVFPTTETGFSPSHTDFGKDLAFLVETMQQQTQLSTSPYYSLLDTTSAVMGHSMGGGSAFLAMPNNSNITALVAIAPAVTTPPYNGTTSPILTPALVFAGANDCVAPPAQHQLPLYDSLSGNCKSYISITGGNHCQFASNNFNCTFGQLTCSPQATITASVQQNTLFTLLLPWLNFYLKNTCAAAGQFQGLVTAGSGITSLQNCSVSCNPSALPSMDDQNVSCTISGNALYTSVPSSFVGNSYEIFTLTGKLLARGTIRQSQQHISLDGTAPGCYLFRCSGRTLKFVCSEGR